MFGPSRASCLSLGSPVGMDKLRRSITVSRRGTEVEQLHRPATKPALINILEGSCIDLRTIGDAVRMVQQPVNALSGVLDNMLLYLRTQRGGEQGGLHLHSASNALDLAYAWESAYRNARASADIERADPNRFRFGVCFGGVQ